LARGDAASGLRREYGNGFCRNAFLAAGKAELFGRCGLHADGIERKAQEFGCADTHGFPVRLHLGGFADHRDVAAGKRIAGLIGQRLGVFQEQAAVGVFPLRGSEGGK
jgi:hypothetical protein